MVPGVIVRTRHHKRALLFLLVVQLLAAFTLRWRLTTDTLKTEFDYLLAQEVIAGDNWRREGALARHFVPSRSIDQTLPEWTYRDDYWRDYLSQPPLSFILQYGAMRMFDAPDPVVVGKLLAQVQIAVGVLIAGAWLVDVFGGLPTLAGLSFLIWGRPFLVFFIDGYYATTTALVCQLLLVAWCLSLFQKKLAADEPIPIRWADYAMVGFLSYAGTMSEWVALFGNAVAAVAFGGVGVVFLIRRSPRARDAVAIAGAIATGTAAAVMSVVVLYGTKVGFAFFWRQLMSRVDERTGAGAFGLWQYTGILIQRMQTSWPAAMLVVLALMALVVLACALGGFLPSRRDTATSEPGLLLLALALGFGAAVTYCYRLQDLVAIHWWFSGTWVIGWTITVCAFACVGRSAIRRIPNVAAARAAEAAFFMMLMAGAIGWNLHFADLSAKEGAVAEGTVVTPSINASHELYRAIGRALPRDGAPLIVADMPELFDDYPFATAYIRRPIVRMDASGALLKIGTNEDAGPALDGRGGGVYVAYDRSLRACAHADATPAAWPGVVPLGLCRVPVSALATLASGIFRDVPGGSDAVLARWLTDQALPPACCAGTAALLDATRVVDSRLRVRSARAIDRLRLDHDAAFRSLTGKWQEQLGGRVHAAEPRFASLFLIGVLAEDSRWFLLLTNLESAPVEDFHAGISVLANGTSLPIAVPYQIRSTDGKALLPLSVIEVRAQPGVPLVNLTLEIVDRGATLLHTTNVTVVSVPRPTMRTAVERDAVLSIGTGCAGPPGPPVELAVRTLSPGRVVLAWSGAYGAPASYALEGGHSPGAIDVTNSDLGGAATTFTATGVPRGIYYLRVRGRNACGVGAPSNEIAVTVP